MDTFSVGIDIGGTFTDIVLCNLSTQKYEVFKTPSTPQDPSIGFMAGLQEILEKNHVKSEQISHIFHGTTTATNAILENDGADVGVLVTEGFKFVLEIGRHGTPRLVNPNSWIKPDRPVKPRNIFEIPGRISVEGEIITPLNELSIVEAVRKFKSQDKSTIAVSFIHSYSNNSHELRAKELILEEYPDASVSLSSEVLAVFREYERTITTVLNAYVSPKVSNYIRNLQEGLSELSIDASLSIMKSNGGMVGFDVAAEQPVQTALSGPAAGVMASVQITKNMGIKDSISFDMGGTSTDVSLIQNQHPTTHLFGKLGDWPIQLPMLDIATIGCGGGSIAEVSQFDSLTVGPKSAGAVPGPVCYEKGGIHPTVTDANLVLGRINNSIAGDALKLNNSASIESIRQKIAEPLGIDIYSAANGILRIANNNMVGAIRNISVERGYDPKDFSLIAYGGAGPMHGIDVANLLGIQQVIVPLHPGMTSAYGLLVSEFKNDYAKTYANRSSGYPTDDLNRVFSELKIQGIDWLYKERLNHQNSSIHFSMDLRYQHQGSEITIPLEQDTIDDKSLLRATDDFHQQHQRLYGFSLDQPVEIITLRVSMTSDVGEIGIPLLPKLNRTGTTIKGRRDVFFANTTEFIQCDIHARDLLQPGMFIKGPAIIEGLDSTVLINPNWQSEIDAYGTCILRKSK